MAIERNPKKNFTQVSNIILSDPKLSWGAKGLLSYFLSKPPEWEMRIDDLLEHGNAGKYGLRRLLRELRGKYIKIIPLFDPKKKGFAGSCYQLIESSDDEKPEMNTKNVKSTSQISSEQSRYKNRASVKVEGLQNDKLNNNTEVLISNTDIKFIDSNTNSTEDKNLYDEVEDNETYTPEFSDDEDLLKNINYEKLQNASAAALEAGKQNGESWEKRFRAGT
jgi:hypothetical protein